MRVGLVTAKDRKLVAVIGSMEDGVFFANNSGKGCVYINHNGQSGEYNHSLDHVLKEDPSRVGIYEGESITLTF